MQLLKLPTMVQNIQDSINYIKSRDINCCRDYLEEPVICLAPIVPWIRQRSMH